ncbi:MAG: ATP-dependent nuclease [Gemmatimonadota bacterium]
MKIRKLRVRHFRSIADIEIECGDLVALVGRNGAGKSCILRALEAFYDSGGGIGVDDFHHRELTQPIRVLVSFSELNAEAQELFAPYMQGNNLDVELVVNTDNGRTSARYHGSRLSRAEFKSVRLAGTAGEKKAAYNALRSDAQFAALPAWQNQAQAMDALAHWEAVNPAGLVREQDDGQFFGFKAVGQGYLGRFTRVVPIPAVREASAVGTEGRGTPLTQLMDVLVRSTLEKREDVAAFKKKLQDDYRALLSPESVTELASVESTLTATIAAFAPSARVAMRWRTLGELDVPLPTADVSLVEDDFEGGVDRVGHGLQRAFVLALLQHLASATTPIASGGIPSASPALLLLFEEPELYQHPSRQRHISAILRRLAGGEIAGAMDGMQVIYSTHSPLMVGIDRFEDIRLLRKYPYAADATRKETRVRFTSAQAVANRSWFAFGSEGPPFTAEAERARMLSALTTSVNEGFFADLAVLLEGESDRAAIHAQAMRMDLSLDALGCALIPCVGKSGLLRPLSVFQQLGIPCYVVWDGDAAKAQQPEQNHRVQRLVGAPVEDWPGLAVTNAYACFPNTLETTLKAELGAAIYDAAVDEALVEYSLSARTDGMKNPYVVRRVLDIAATKGKECATLRLIVEAIAAAAQSV